MAAGAARRELTIVPPTSKRTPIARAIPAGGVTISLESCWAKMDRAKEHRDVLDRYLRDTFSLETNRPRLGIRFDADAGQHVLYVSHFPDLDLVLKRVGLCLGDIMHNFRSALDHLTYQLALWNSGGQVSRPKRVQFPILDDPSHFQSARGDALRDVHPDHQAIIERFQPYRRIAEGLAVGRDFHSFAVLRDLDNADKVSQLALVLMPPASLSAYRGDAMTIVKVGLQQHPDWAPPAAGLGLNAELVRASLPAPGAIAETETAGHIIPLVGVPEGWPIDHLIDRIASLILKVIGEFQLSL